MRIAFFGGRFDPVHNGHLTVAREVLRVHACDKVWFVPDFTHQWNPIIASFNDRITMLKLVLEKNMKVLDVAKKNSPSKFTETYIIVKMLRQKYPEHEFIFVGGSDLLLSFNKWTHWQELEKELKFLIVARRGFAVVNLPPNCTVLEDLNYRPIKDSATRIRTYIQEGKSIDGLVSEKVADFIQKHHIY